MYCRHCGKLIDDRAVICPYCATSTDAGQANNQNANQNYAPNSGYKSTQNTIAIVGFVLSFFFALAGLVCSIIGYNKAKNEGLDNKGLAIAGIIISAIEMVVSVIYVVCLIIIICVAGIGALL